MIAYLDASALVKRYVAEAGSTEVNRLISEAEALGTAIISRAEVSAALAKAVRVKAVSRGAGTSAVRAFTADWDNLIRLQLTEVLVARAAALAWEHGLRGYDGVHLATALFWYETLDEVVTVATYDRELWKSAKISGLSVWPSALP
jgi:predicted nucleic acid-binding protein